ncbi:hypothetical protein FS749_005798 [Ceratobasidium sp. UAMH 11750]|nr:hypothetical protein FS749_005798 [Ceratobasidium sp. UAMH 11750]
MKERAEGRVMVDVMSFRLFNPNQDDWDSEDLGEDCAKKDTWVCTLSEDHPDLCLLPSALQGWSFAAKKWGHLLVEKLSLIPFQADVFKHLVVPEDEKKLIQALVEAQAGLRGMTLINDIISGKGAGLVILLHGNPGTGKLPLYAVSCSEFGTSLEKVETKLKHILDITSLWKAVVLIDEADIFLEARSDDLSRNAMVGVFLRMLEYHSGIVILTTNRVRTLDDAFRSRISLALKYRDLDCHSRKMLWKKFLNLTGATVQDSDSDAILTYDFSLQDLDELSQRDTNGRVIKHVVRTSQALALADGKQLNRDHIERVWKILDAFEEDLRPDPCPQK